MKFVDTALLLSTALLLVRVGAATHNQDNGNKGVLRRRTMLSRNVQESAVTGLVLMYTGVNPSVPVMNLSFDSINIVDLQTLSLPDAKFSIDALTSIDSKSVIFSNGQCETAPPLAYCGNSGYAFNSCSDLVLGANVTITVKANTEKYCGGVAIATRSVTIHIVRSSIPVPPTVSSTTAPLGTPTVVHAPVHVPTIAPLQSKAPTLAAIQRKAPISSPALSPSSSGITGLVLMYTGVDPSVPVMNLYSGSINIVDLEALSLPTAKFSIDAMIGTDSKSVVFSNGQYETAAPLAYCGNNGYTFRTCPDLVLGANVTVSAMAFSEKYGAGVLVAKRSVTIHIIKSQIATPVLPTLAPAAPVLRTSAPVAPISPIRAPIAPISPVPTTAAPVLRTSAPVAPISPIRAPVAPMSPVRAPAAPVLQTSAPVAPISPIWAPATPVLWTSAPVAPISPIRAPIRAPVAPISPIRAPVTNLLPLAIPVPVSDVPSTKGCTIPRFTGNWDGNTAKYPIQVAEAQGTMIGKDFIITSGFNGGYNTATPETYALDMFTPNARWRRMDDMPFPIGLTHLGVAVKGTKAFFCGGYTGGSLGVHDGSCFQYDHSIAPGMGQWTNFSSLPDEGRAGGGMIYDSTLDALVYAAGSHRPKRYTPFAIDYQNTWMYSLRNPEAGWVPRADIPFKGNHMNFVTAYDETGKERHYFFGGQHGDNEETGNTDEMFEYSAIEDVWTKRQSIPYPLGHAAATARAIGCGFIVAGGRLNHGLTKEITYYDIPTNTWTKIGDLPQEIHTNVCVIANGVLRCETGWATGTFSWKRSISV